MKIFLTQISPITQILWEDARLAYPILFFRPANSKRQRRDLFQPSAQALGNQKIKTSPVRATLATNANLAGTQIFFQLRIYAK